MEEEQLKHRQVEFPHTNKSITLNHLLITKIHGFFQLGEPETICQQIYVIRNPSTNDFALSHPCLNRFMKNNSHIL